MNKDRKKKYDKIYFTYTLTAHTHCIHSLHTLTAYRWYHSRLSRHVAESLLFGSSVGTYLIRESASTSNCLTLSVR